MDIAEKMAADIALAIDGGDWQDAKWFSKFHRDAWIKAVKPYANEIKWLREQCYRMASLAIDNAKDTERAMRFRKALREICEVYAGSEGIPQPMTAAEGYLLSLLKETVGIAQKALKEVSDGYC